jgi:hypothetical protein
MINNMSGNISLVEYGFASQVIPRLYPDGRKKLVNRLKMPSASTFSTVRSEILPLNQIVL